MLLTWKQCYHILLCELISGLHHGRHVPSNVPSSSSGSFWLSWVSIRYISIGLWFHSAGFSRSKEVFHSAGFSRSKEVFHIESMLARLWAVTKMLVKCDETTAVSWAAEWESNLCSCIMHEQAMKLMSDSVGIPICGWSTIGPCPGQSRDVMQQTVLSMQASKFHVGRYMPMDSVESR